MVEKIPVEIKVSDSPAVNNEEGPLDLEIIFQGFKECLTEDGLLLDGYIRAYTEITK